MTKNRMKLSGVVIMIMLVMDFAKVDFNYSFVQIELNKVSSKLTCGPKCDLSCLPYALIFILYPICVASCMKECHKTSSILFTVVLLVVT